MRILCAPAGLALDPAAPIAADLFVHNDSAEDGLAFPTFVSDEAAAEATFEPTVGFLAAGTAQHFRVHVRALPRRRTQSQAHWILFADGQACDRRECKLVSFDAVPAPSLEPETPPSIDAQRKTEILALAQRGAAEVPVRHRHNLTAALAFAFVAVLVTVASVGLAPHDLVPQRLLAVAAPAPFPARARATRVLKVPAPRPPPIAKRPLPDPAAPRSPAARPRRLRIPRAHFAAPAASARIRRTPQPPAVSAAAPPVLVLLDAPQAVRADSTFSVNVTSKRATTMRIVAKIGPAIFFERTLPAREASAPIRAPAWAGHAQLLTVRVWVKNAAGAASGYATVALLQQLP